MALWRMHVELEDRPGRLGDLATAVGAAGCNADRDVRAEHVHTLRGGAQQIHVGRPWPAGRRTSGTSVR